MRNITGENKKITEFVNLCWAQAQVHPHILTAIVNGEQDQDLLNSRLTKTQINMLAVLLDPSFQAFVHYRVTCSGDKGINSDAPYYLVQKFKEKRMIHPFACYHTALNDVPKVFSRDWVYIIEWQREFFEERHNEIDIRRLVYHL